MAFWKHAFTLVVTCVCRFLGAGVMGGIVGFIFNWIPFLFGSARNQLPWHLLFWWFIGGGIVGLFTVPEEQRPGWWRPLLVVLLIGYVAFLYLRR